MPRAPIAGWPARVGGCGSLAPAGRSGVAARAVQLRVRPWKASRVEAMAFKVMLLAALVAGTLAACAGDATPGRSTAASDQDGPSLSRKPSLESCIQAGMPYAQFRKELLSRGWEPMADAHCRANVIGSRPGVCAKTSELCRVCDDLPELSVYAPDGVAVMWFRHPRHGHELHASAFGDITDRHRALNSSRFRLVGWDVSGDGQRVEGR